MKYFRIIILAFVISMVISNSPALGADGYTLIDLGVPSVFYDDVYPIDINNAGQVVGWANPTDSAFNFQKVYFVVTPENGVWFKDVDGDGGNDLMQLLAPPESLFYSITDINDSGHVIGELSTNGFFFNKSYIWKNGIFTILGAPGGLGVLGSKLYSINNIGQVVGYMKVDTTRAETEAYIWNDGIPTNFSNDFLVGTDMFINDLGEVLLHRISSDVGAALEPVLVSNGTVHAIKNGNTFRSEAFAINNNSQVVGIDVGNSEAFIWENNQMTLLGPETFFGYDINNNGEVVGALRGNIGQHFLWLPEPAYGFSAGLKVMDMNIPPPGRIDKMEDINDSGVILVAGRLFGYDHAFVLLPIPPPTIIVNSVDDVVDNNPGDGICNTGNTISNGDPECTMRAALMESNSLSDNVVIEFDIPVEPTIQPDSALPLILDTVYIAGYTQPGGSPVLLDGVNAGVNTNGLESWVDFVVIEGLSIGRFNENGILLLNASSNQISGCIIGFTNGLVDFGNKKNGISLVGSSYNVIGGENSWESNSISNNVLDGISLTGASIGNYIVNNSIGAGLSGNDIGNGENGIFVGANADSNIVGADNILGIGNNVIGNGKHGIHLYDSKYSRVIANDIIDNKRSGLVLEQFSKFNEVFVNNIGIADDYSPAGNLENGIEILTFSDSNHIGGGFLAGNTVMYNAVNGILLREASFNNINENVFSANNLNGMQLDFRSVFNNISSNKIGIDYFDVEAGNLNSGIQVATNSNFNFIGDKNIIKFNHTEGVCIKYADNNIVRSNIISSNFGTGVIIDSTSKYNSIIRNKIGLDSSGAAAGNSKYGVEIINGADSNFIGGIKPDGNVISKNNFSGILIDTSNFNQIRGNIIGLDTTGLIAMGNHLDGVTIVRSYATVVGVGIDVDSNLTGAGNIIGANDSSGVYISSKSLDTWLTSNLIGCGVDTIKILPNFRGISVFDSPNTFIGGRGFFNEYLGNTIYTNLETGIWLQSDWSTVYGNYIWSNGYGVLSGDLAINGAGIYVKGMSNTIGGYTILAGNSIFGNKGVGIFIDSIAGDSDDKNYIRYNWITENFRGGIDLFPIGSNLNDTLDADGGPNAGQNKPLILTSTLTGTGQIFITGSLSSEPNLKYIIDFYSNSVCDSLGLGQGEVWMASDTISTDAFGFSNFYTLADTIIGFSTNFITATVTNFYIFNTSEFSNCNNVLPQAPGVDLMVEKTDNLDSLLFADTVTYEITVKNIGSDNATNVIMRDSLPQQLTYISDSTSLGICTELDGIVQCNLGSLNAGVSATITIVAVAVDSGLTENSAIVSSNSNDLQPLNNYIIDSTFIVTRFTTDIGDDHNNLPIIFELSQNYPNPFNPSTEINFSLPTKSYVTLEVFNIVGQKVRTLLDTQISAGFHSITWDGNDTSDNQVASGVYLYRLKTDDFTSTRKMLLLK